MGNYAGTAALLIAFDMQLDPGQPPPLPKLEHDRANGAVDP